MMVHSYDSAGSVWRPPAPAAPVGEVVESSTTMFVAQSCELDRAPHLGTFVVVSGEDNVTAIGVVAYVETSGIDPSARTIMRGYGAVRDLEIYLENPDLPHVLRTTFTAILVGFSQDGAVFQYLPPRPPRLHFSVRLATVDMLRAFTAPGFAYLDALLGAADIPVDEVIAANIRLTAAACPEVDGVSETAGRFLAHALRSDYARLTGILRRLSAAR